MPNTALIVATYPQDNLNTEIDSKNMISLLQKQGFSTIDLHDDNATPENVKNYLNLASQKTKPGETFVFYYSGHGSQKYDDHGHEIDRKQELLNLNNGDLSDLEIHRIWKTFKKDSRILMIADCCHSGTNYGHDTERPYHVPEEEALSPEVEPPYCDDGVCYPPITKIPASLVHFGSSKDFQYSRDTKNGGLFTNKLLEVWNDGEFSGNYNAFYHAIKELVIGINPEQHSQLNIIPEDNNFAQEKPFTIHTLDATMHQKNNSGVLNIPPSTIEQHSYSNISKLLLSPSTKQKPLYDHVPDSMHIELPQTNVSKADSFSQLQPPNSSLEIENDGSTSSSEEIEDNDSTFLDEDVEGKYLFFCQKGCSCM
ncbi:MAG: caspase family protein [Gammaproteobacteria bacterium]|nr:caspase family protein [Gammaproteobacteria bacterium]